ncbi:Uncharacterised protein [BD1-7 clade bacterium]|uniref:Uncharacterized protein n=1 Tax=BD1-7 clade bacterium TaxID=2029982 RepID=A0A5S9PH00_9GAMM|nr:Uncharacterised protein [BD1-7 clade bacterium]CAA0103267.1 Uncharacterised protein [BD1-7 clade bacterium]
MKKLLLPIAFSSLALQANADRVPHEFTAGTATKSAQVNENFSYLANRVPGEADIQASYDYVAKNPGDVVDIQGESFTIYRIPYHDVVTGKNYSITLPLNESKSRIYSEHVGDIAGQITFIPISGQKAAVAKTCEIFFRPLDSNFDHSCDAKAYIFLRNGSAMVFNIDHKVVFSDSSEVSQNSPYDFIQTSPSSDVYNPDEKIDDFIDHIKFEELAK